MIEDRLSILDESALGAFYVAAEIGARCRDHVGLTLNDLNFSLAHQVWLFEMVK